MARKPQDITDAELAVLEVLWNESPCNIRQITELLYPHGGASQYATVQKLLERLETKGCVRRDRSEAVHCFAPAIDRNELIGRRLQTVAETLCGGSWTPLLTHLVQNQKLSQHDRQALRQLIEDLDHSPRAKKDRR